MNWKFASNEIISKLLSNTGGGGWVGGGGGGGEGGVEERRGGGEENWGWRGIYVTTPVQRNLEISPRDYSKKTFSTS